MGTQRQGWPGKGLADSLTCGPEHPHFVHLGLGHVQHQPIAGKEVFGSLRA